MAFGIVGSIVEAMMLGPESGDVKAMSIAGVDPIDPTKLLLTERTFQYWPETIQDSIEIGWNFRDIPGASHALAQWGSNNGRTITFEVQLHRFQIPYDDKEANNAFTVRTFGSSLLTRPDDQYLKDVRHLNVDIRNEIRFLRGFCYPSYREVEGRTVAHPPPIAILDIPGVGLNESGGNTIFAVMTSCDVTYTLLFPNGVPRRATVALTFKQVVQREEGVFFKGWGGPAPYKDPISTAEFTENNNARPLNNITGPGDVK